VNLFRDDSVSKKQNRERSEAFTPIQHPMERQIGHSWHSFATDVEAV